MLAKIDERAINYDLVLDGKEEEELKQNARYVLAVGRKLGCTIFVVWEDIVEVKQKMILTFVAAIKFIAEGGKAEAMPDISGAKLDK